MNAEHFATFKHEAIHELRDLNERCDRDLQIFAWPRWDYDLDRGTLTFSRDGVPGIRASIQVIGSTSKTGGTWLWAWANTSLPENVTQGAAGVRAFGQTENLPSLTEASLPDDEYLGWEMTAVAAKVLAAKGAYRCPGDNGFLYMVYTTIGFVSGEPEPGTGEVKCETHGVGFSTYVCEHLVSDPAQEWFSSEPSDTNKWPDAWCVACDVFFQEQGEWNDKNEGKMKIKLLCHHCYERLRSREKLSK